MDGIHYRARAPLRIGLAGGGTDVDPYASKKGGAVFNTTINRYAYCTITPTGDHSMSVHSTDYGKYEAPLDGGPLPLDGNMDLIKAVTNHFEIKDGFRLFLQSEAPPGSGLGGSSTVMVSIIAATCEWLGIKMTGSEMAQLAYRLEREEIGLKGGKQDQYAAVFGGFNLMKFAESGVDVNRVRISEDTINELQYCSLLCYTGSPRESAKIIESQVDSFKSGQNEEALDESRKLAFEMSSALERGNITKAGELLDLSWQYKKQFSNKISNPQIDAFYEAAKAAGAIGGKVSGAGGGGFMYFICRYDRKYSVAQELQKLGARITDYMFEPRGVISWRYPND
ncbi:MAG: kinase [Candidatus Methanomethylophilaceae archaeon]|nr:kinase [Candidatus Methanomethylophilaceae archaeon]